MWVRLLFDYLLGLMYATAFAGSCNGWVSFLPSIPHSCKGKLNLSAEP